MKVGFIGLGIMGRPMALNLIKAGHQLYVHARRQVPGALIDACAAHGGSGWDHSAMVRALELMANHDVGAQRRAKEPG